jgi:hypothetical protein
VVTPAAAQLLRAPGASRLKIMAAGLKVFERGHDEQALHTGGCAYRMVQEGLRAALPHAARQRVAIPLAEFTRLIRDRTLYFAAADHTKAQPSFEPATAAALAALTPGCCILVPELSGAAPLPAPRALPAPEDLAIVAWKGKVSLAVLVSKPEGTHLLHKLYRLCPQQAPAALAAAEAAAAGAAGAAAEPAAAE